MLDTILAEVAKLFPLDTIHGVFLSAFDKQNNLIVSQGSLETTKSLSEIIPLLYKSFDHNQLQSIVVDVVCDITQHTEKNSLLDVDLSLFGIFAIADNGVSGVVLPNTLGVLKVSDALALMKKKYRFSSKIGIYTFSVKRIVI